MAEQKFPEPTVGCLILNPKGEIFLMKSHKWKGKYVLPGGHIELGETAKEALKREVKEEIGLDIYGIKFLILQEFVYSKEFWKKRHFIFLDFLARTKSTEVKLDSEGEEFVWVKPKEALKLPVEPYTTIAIRKCLEL